MGGNIWKDLSVRLSLEDYLKVEEEIISLLKSLQPDIIVRRIAFIRDKKDFGDLDLIVSNVTIDLLNQLQQLGYLVNNNGNVLSFLYNSFQIDLIKVPKPLVDYSVNYFSWNDAGNLLGRMSKSLGFKHSHYGLYFIHRGVNNDKIYNEYLLSNQYTDVIKYLQLDINKYLQGFNTKEELFKWIISSPYFNADKFKFENLNHQNKVRDRKRSTYNEFLKYLEDNNLYGIPPKIIIEDKLKYLYSIYPELEACVETDLIKEINSNLISKYFNGELISNITGIPLKTKDLGDFIKYFKIKYSRTELLSSIVYETTETLIKEAYRTFKA